MMMKLTKLKTLLTLIPLFIFLLFANAQRTCIVPDVRIQSTEEDSFNTYVNFFKQNGWHLNTDIKIIPVVVHVLYNQPSDTLLMNFARMQKTIDRTNLYLRRLHHDTTNTHQSFKSVAKDVHIQLCLATKRADGTTFNGVIYTPSFNNSQLLDIKRYLNVLVKPGVDVAHASFPWQINDTVFHGISIGYSLFGYLDPGMLETGREGKVFVHEVGHYLGLYHTFEGGLSYLGDCSRINDPMIGDLCGDTPLDWSFFPIPGSACDHPWRYCNNGDSIKAQVENFMHYNRDECLNMFSDDQRSRMRACLNNTRAVLVSQANLDFTGANCNPLQKIKKPESEKDFVLYPNPSLSVFYVKNLGQNRIERINIYSNVGQLIFSSASMDETREIDIRQFSSGIYIVEIIAGKQKSAYKMVKQ